jgi:hypothetical protein
MLLKPVVTLSGVIVDHDGRSMTLKEWARFLNIPYATLRMRYTRGKRGDDLFQQVRAYIAESEIGWTYSEDRDA